MKTQKSQSENILESRFLIMVSDLAFLNNDVLKSFFFKIDFKTIVSLLFLADKNIHPEIMILFFAKTTQNSADYPFFIISEFLQIFWSPSNSSEAISKTAKAEQKCAA